MAKQQYLAASVHGRDTDGNFISSYPIFIEGDDEEVFDELGNKIEVNPVPAIPEAFYRSIARKMHNDIMDGKFVPGGWA